MRGELGELLRAMAPWPCAGRRSGCTNEASLEFPDPSPLNKPYNPPVYCRKGDRWPKGDHTSVWDHWYPVCENCARGMIGVRPARGGYEQK